MNTLKNNLEQREKAELIAIIHHMLLQEYEAFLVALEQVARP
jgi:hypothetical protein